MSPRRHGTGTHFDVLVAARDATLLAAAACRRAQSEVSALRAAIKDDRSPVTVADFASQALVSLSLRESLGSRFDQTGLVAEEDPDFLRRPEHSAHLEATLEIARTVRPDLTAEALLATLATDAHGSAETADAARSEGFFTLDPIDGTKGFLRGQQYAVALAYVYQGYPVVGALACPNLPLDAGAATDAPDPVGSLYLAARGSGTWEQPCLLSEASAAARAVPPPESLERRIRVTASVERGHSNGSDTDRVLAFIGGDPEVLRLDSSAKYAVVARGQADAYLRLPTRGDYVERIWDHAAGVVVAEEAGAIVSDITGAPLDFSHGRGLERNRGIVVAHRDIHPRLIVALAGLGLT